MTIAPVGILVVDTATVRCASATLRFTGSVPTSESHTRYRSQVRAATFAACSTGWSLIFTSLTTAPPFWASPVMSTVRADRPSSVAAVAITCEIVTTPVPPIPVIRIENVRSPRCRLRCDEPLGDEPRNPVRRRCPLAGGFELVPRTSTSDGGTSGIGGRSLTGVRSRCVPG